MTTSTTFALVSAGAAVLAVLLLRRRRPLADQATGMRPPAAILAAASVLAAPVLVLGRERLVPVALAAATGGAGWWLWRRRRRRRDEHALRGRVLEACEQLAAELRAGRPPGEALTAVAADWPLLAPVAAAHAMGADVPAAVRLAAQRPGAGDLRLLAAGWQVSHRSGQGLAASVARVADDLVAARRTRRVVEGELASARATARLVAALPLLAWAMGTGAGGSPVGFLLGSPAGWACLALGAAFGLGGLCWIEAIARDVDRAT